jgi:DNA-binding SARP family transcriptional activator
MEALAAQSNTAEALRVYEQLRELLAAELGIAPSAATRELHARLLALV